MRRPGAIIIGVLTVLGFLIPLAEAASAPVDSFPSTAVGDAPFSGSAACLPLARPVVGIAASPGGRGYWLVASDGGIFSFGDAAFFGSTGSIRLNKPIVGGTATSDDRGYWLVASDGGIFSFGDAPFSGSGAGGSLAAPVVGMATSGAGYALATANGLVAAFGTAAAALGVPAGQPQGTPGESPAGQPKSTPTETPPGQPQGTPTETPPASAPG